MAGFKKIAKELGLEDLNQDFPGDKICKSCGGKLRLGKDKNNYGQAYCPKCKKIIRTVFMPRFSPGIKVEPHDD